MSFYDFNRLRFVPLERASRSVENVYCLWNYNCECKKSTEGLQCVSVFADTNVCVGQCTHHTQRVLCQEGHGQFLLCAGVMAGPSHLHTFAFCQTELLLTASRFDCLPGPQPNPVGMVTRHSKAWRCRLAAKPISLDKSFGETSFSVHTSAHHNDLQLSLSKGKKHRTHVCWFTATPVTKSPF